MSRKICKIELSRAVSFPGTSVGPVSPQGAGLEWCSHIWDSTGFLCRKLCSKPLPHGAVIAGSFGQLVRAEPDSRAADWLPLS